MSKDKESKKLVSTARNIHSIMLLRFIGILCGLNLAAAVIFTGVAMVFIDKAAFGRVRTDALRNVYVMGPELVYSAEIDETLWKDNIPDRHNKGFEVRINYKKYTVTSEFYNGEEHQYLDNTLLMHAITAFAVIFLIFEIFSMLDFAATGIRPIRSRLKPLDEITRNAYKISTMPLDEERIQNLETAISQIAPGESEMYLETNDKEFKGLEAAINAMIDRLRNSYRQQVRFVSDASHELRTPIAVIKGYADMLDRWGKEDSGILEESITAIRNESAHMNELVEQLLFLARGDSGRQPLKLQQISLSDMMREVYEESLMIDEKHCYECKVADRVNVNADAAMLKQTARILIDNAAKYTSEGSRIVIGCGYNENKFPFFYIEDAGIGMGKEDVMHMFERFYRADDARYSKAQGSGLGLSIAKWIVERHGGHIDVLSRKEIGTRISVVLAKC